jgi:hypothetical protein
MKRWHILLLLFIVAFLPYSKALLSGQTLGPTEHIQTMITPGAPKPTYGWDILQADGVLQFLPWRDLVFDAWRHGEAPMINPYQLAGQPLTANSQSGGFYPLHILFAFVPGTTATKIVLLGILHLFIAGFGLFTIGFSLSQFMAAWAPLASVPTTVAWIPWILAGIISENKKSGFFVVSFATAMMLLAGHLQFAFYGLFAAVLVILWTIIKDRKIGMFIPLLAIGVGSLVAYPQVSLVLKNSQTSHRKNVPTEGGYQGYAAGVLAPFEALSFISPKLMGDPSVKNSDLGDNKVPTGYWPMIVKRGANPAESALWVSPVILSLAFLGLIMRRNKESDAATVVPAVVMIVLGVLLAFGSPLNRLLFFEFPGWSATGSAGRAHILIVLGICVAGAVGYDRLIVKNDGSKKWFAIGLIPLLLLAVGFNVMNMLGGILGPQGDDTLSKLISITTKPQLQDISLLAIISSLTLLGIVKSKAGKALTIAFALIATTYMWVLPLSGGPLEIPKLGVPSQDRAVFVSRSWNMAQTPNATMPPNIASLARVHDLFGYDSILDAGFVKRLSDAMGVNPAPRENGNMMLPQLRNDVSFSADQTAALASLGASSIDQKYPESSLVNSRIVAVNDHSTSSQGSAEIEYDGYDHQIIKATEGTTSILIRDRWFEGMTTPTPNATVENQDGWRHITTDGKQTLIRINYPGRNNVIGVIIGLAILLFGLINTLRKHEPDPISA